MDWLTKEEAIQRFMFGDSVLASWINLPMLVFLIHEALERDGHDIDFDRIWSEVIIPPMREDGGSQTIGGDARFQLPTVVYLHYADWSGAISRLLGADPDADIQPDCLEGSPCTRVVVKALAGVAVRVSMAASKAYEEQHGHSMMEVFMATCETGEDFDQSQTRLSAQQRGLRPVN